MCSLELSSGKIFLVFLFHEERPVRRCSCPFFLTEAYLYTETSVKSKTSHLYSARTRGNTGYCIRSLKDRQACLFSSVKYAKFVSSPFCHLKVKDNLLRKSQCSPVQSSAVQCSAVQCSAVQCSAVQCSAVQCSAV